MSQKLLSEYWQTITNIVTPLCLAFFYEFSQMVYRTTTTELLEISYGKNGEYYYSNLFTCINFGSQILTTPYWTRLAQQSELGRKIAIAAAITAGLLPSFVVFIGIGINQDDTVPIFKAYMITNSVCGLLGLPIALAFSIVKIDLFTRKGTTEDSSIDPVFIVMMSVPMAVLIGNAAGEDTPRIGYCAVYAFCANLLSAVIIVVDSFLRDKAKALEAASKNQGGLAGEDALAKKGTLNQMIFIKNNEALNKEADNDEEAASKNQGGLAGEDVLAEKGTLNPMIFTNNDKDVKKEAGNDDIPEGTPGSASDAVDINLVFKWLKNRDFRVVAITLGLLQFGHETFFNNAPLYVFTDLKPKYGLTNTKAFIGTLLMIGALLNMSSLLVLPSLLGKYLGFTLNGFVNLGLVSASLGYLLYGFATDKGGFIVAEVAGGCVLLAKPALVGMVVRIAGKSNEGESTGALLAVGHIGSIMGLFIGAIMFPDIGGKSFFVLFSFPVLGLLLLYYFGSDNIKHIRNNTVNGE